MAEIPAWLQGQCERLIANDGDLTNLNLNIRHLNLTYAIILSDAIVQNKHLCVLNLTSALVRNGSTTLQPIVERVIPHTSTLRVLHLSYNRLTRLEGLGTAMGENDSILELHLDYNALGPDEAVALAEGLSKNKTLRVLQLGHNDIGDIGFHAFAQLLATNDTLRRLGLDRNQITNASHLVDILQRSNRWIHHISLCQNENIPEDQQRLVEYWTQTNRYGRARQEHIPTRLWPVLLARIREPAPLCYFVHTTLWPRDAPTAEDD